MSQKNSFSYLKQLSLSLITLVLGSFIFVGVLENYRGDESIKSSQLENYFKPAREAGNICLKKQNDLFLHYPQYGGAFLLLFSELNHLVDNPRLDSSVEYGMVLEGYAKYLSGVLEAQNYLPSEVEECREAVFLKLEALSIVTGIYDRFVEASSKRADSLNAVDKNLRYTLKENVKGLDGDELLRMLRRFGEVDMRSEEGLKELVLSFGDKLTIIQEYSVAMAKAEQEKYDIEAEFFSVIRSESASRINSSFKQGFFSWLFR